jgi:phosphohistidine swiveling domain-containing protein
MDNKEGMDERQSEHGQDIGEKVAALMKNEDRKDAEFRLALLMSELGDIAKYITHDPRLNPGARKHGSKEEEHLAYGQAEVMFRALCHIRGIDYDQALALGMKNWMDADWRQVGKKEEMSGDVRGLFASPGTVEGLTYKVDKHHPFDTLVSKPWQQTFRNAYERDPVIVIMEHASPDIVLIKDNLLGVVTDQGGRTCHAAIIAREFGIPCIVGAGNATQKIGHQWRVRIEPDPADPEYGIVKVIDFFTDY